jgi:hypothetical protein
MVLSLVIIDFGQRSKEHYWGKGFMRSFTSFLKRVFLPGIQERALSLWGDEMMGFK